MTTQAYDNNRTGANLSETILNTSNVNVSAFGKLFARVVDGQIYAQPLYVQNLTIQGSTHNVVFVCTEHNSVYAFDADSPAASTALWQVSLGPSLPAGVINSTRDLLPEIGITGTPTIDMSSHTMYVVAETYEGGDAIFRLHALDLFSGAEKFSGPVVISGSVPGTGVGSSGGTLAFDPLMHWQRPGLALSNGTIYIGFGSHQDTEPYHGWIFAYTTGLVRTTVLCTSANDDAGGVWQGGVGLAIDPNGFMYVATGQGTMDANDGGVDRGDSILKLDTSKNLFVDDYFSPSNESSLTANDVDFGAGGTLLIPGTPFIVAGGKDGRLFLLNNANLGQFHPTDQMTQEWQGSNAYFGGKVYYNSTLYAWGRSDYLKTYAFNGSTFNTSPIEGTIQISSTYSDQPAMAISANGVVSGTPILWVTYPVAGGADGHAYPGILRAFDAAHITTELWNSNDNQARDNSGSWSKWCLPTIANGKVYVATFDNILNVYGLLPTGGGQLSGAIDTSATPANLTTEGTADWEHWGDGTLNRKSGVPAQISNYTVLGNSAVATYSNDPRPMSWSDGTPTASSTNNLNGVFVVGIGQGFSITAPSDTTTRTLVIHAGGFNSAGTFTAQLSDGSGPVFTDTTTVAVGQFDRNYTLTYHSASTGVITVTWQMTSGTGNLTLNGASLSGAVVNPPGSIVASGGTPQSTTISTAFATPLSATVTDGSGNPLSNQTVAFTAPGSGPTASFAGSTIATATTNTSGVATAPTLTANNQAGAYTVTASVTGLQATANFNLTNNPAVQGGGALAGSVTSSTAAANLTTEGNSDWEHWGDGSLNRKAGVPLQLNNYTLVGAGNVANYNNDLRLLNWTDGTPTGTSSNNRNGVYINGVGQGFSITAPADSNTRTMVLHAGGFNSAGTLTATLSDGSASPFTDITQTMSGQYDRNYTLTYNSVNAGQITVTWKMTSGGGNVTLNGVALSGAASNPPASIVSSTGTPQTATISTAFATALAATVKDSGGNVLSGITVTFTAPGSGASGTFGGSASVTAVTNSSGIATAPTFTANSIAGAYGVTASVAGVSTTANFSLTNKAGAPASIVTSGGSGQSAAISTAFATALSATVTDSGGNALSGVSVTFTAPGSGASGTFGGLAAASSTTNPSGVATAPTLTANSVAGAYTVAATVGGVATPANFSLTNKAGSAASIVASGGTSQSTTVNAAFTTPLAATVKDAGGNLLSGVSVTFTAPASGASGTFGGLTTANSTTNPSGVATAPTLTANSQAGSYTVTATVGGVATPANYSLTNNAVVGSGGSLVASSTSVATAVNLTTEGGTDWVHWGDGSLNRKSGVTAQLSTYTVVGSGNVSNYGNDPRPVSWTDGTPTGSSPTNHNGIYINNTGQGFSFTAPADTTTRTLVVHVGGFNSGGTLVAHLSDGSATDITDVTPTTSGQYDRNFTLTYNAATSGVITVTWKMSSGSGNVTLNAAALQ